MRTGGATIANLAGRGLAMEVDAVRVATRAVNCMDAMKQ